MQKIWMFAALLFAAACTGDGTGADAYGNFEADDLIVSAEGSGRILQFTAEEGTVLGAGDTVGMIDAEQLMLRREQLEASIRAVAAKSPAIREQLAVFEKQSAAVQQQIGTIEKEKRRVEALIKNDAATPKQLDDLNAQLEAAQRQLDVVAGQQSATNASLSVQKGGLLAEITPLQKQISQLDDQIARCRITNPAAGTVLVTYAGAGEVTAMGKPLYKIADLSKLILRAYVSGKQLSAVKIGQEVKVSVDGGDGSMKELTGKITWISPRAEFTPKVVQTKEERVNLVYAVKISVPNADGMLKIGMPGEVRF